MLYSQGRAEEGFKTRESSDQPSHVKESVATRWWQSPGHKHRGVAGERIQLQRQGHNSAGMPVTTPLGTTVRDSFVLQM